VVFCRNVLMYLTPSAARQVVAHITHALVPGGHLFLGHAETLRGLSQDYELCQADTAFYYRRRPPADRASMARAGRRPVMPVTSAGWTPPSWTPHWADAIGQAAERIRRLTADRSPAAPVHDPGGARPPLDQALALLRHERFAEALDLLQALPERAAGEPEVRLLRAVLLTHGGHFDAAATACLPLLREQGLAPEGADHGQGTARPRRSLQAGAYYVLALCREAAGDAAGAMQHDRAAAQLDPTFAMPHLHLGLVALRQGERALAGQALTSALALLPGTDDLHLLLFGGGFRRDTLAALCRAELRRCRHDERAS
jgi:chemotaxis protein methyltransferase CheR